MFDLLISTVKRVNEFALHMELSVSEFVLLISNEFVLHNGLS